MQALSELEQARELVLHVASTTECAWCRSHVVLVADAIKDLERLATLGEAAKEDPELIGNLRKLGSMADELHLLAVLARVAGWVRTFSRALRDVIGH